MTRTEEEIKGIVENNTVIKCQNYQIFKFVLFLGLSC